MHGYAEQPASGIHPLIGRRLEYGIAAERMRNRSTIDRRKHRHFLAAPFFLISHSMEHISKNNSLETAKNRLDISGLTYIEGTKYVYDRIVNKGLSNQLIKYIPLIETSNGYVLRYKNLMRQYYWLTNEFIPSCSYEKLCMRNGEKTWIQYENIFDVLRKYLTFSFYDDDNLITTISVLSGNTATPFTPTKVGYNFSGWTTENGGSNFFDFSTPIGVDTSVYAAYEIKQIKLTFILNNDQESKVIFVDYGTTSGEILQKLVDEGIIPEKEGYTFAGWYPEITTATKNTIYEATYTRDIYIVRFFNIIDAEHILDYYNEQPISGGVSTEYTLLKTETHALHDHSTYYTTKPTYQHFECMEEDGYTWWIDREGRQISASTFIDITQDIDVFPKLTKKNYMVSFLDWDNTLISSYTVEYLSGVTAPGNPERQNYTFAGWDRPYSSITDDTVIHATYVGDGLNVTYWIPDTGGTFMIFSSITSTFGTTAPTVEPPKTETYPPEKYGVFDGWYEDTGYTTPFDYTVLLDGDTEIYGKWKTEFEVTFYNWDGSLITGDTQTGFANPVYVSYGEDVTDAELDLIIYNMADKPGYEFLGWNKSTTGITYDVRITAVFDDIQMCLVRFINSVDGSVISSTTVPYASTILVSAYPEAPEVEHMTFINWEGNTSAVYGDVDVYAMYEYVDVQIQFVDYNGNILGTRTVKYNDTGFTPDDISVPDLQIRLDMENNPEILSTLRFNGTYCYVRDEFDPETGCSTPEEMVITADITQFAAQYDVIATEVTTLNIRFYNYDSVYWFTDTVLYGTVIDSAYSQTILDVFASEGHAPDLTVQTFYAWADEHGNEYVIGQNELTVTESISLHAKYKMISYKVQFYVQSNPDYYPEIIDMPIQSLETEAIKNTAINRPDCSNVPERIHFETFCEGLNNRWYTDSACTNEWTFKQDVQMQPVSNPDLVTEDIILYGKYIGIEYHITYNTNGGSSITQETYRYPMPTVRTSDPTKQDSTFIGWYIDNDTFEDEFVFGQPLESDITIYAKWFEAPEENTILYNANADLRTYMPDMGSAHLLQEECIWDIATGDGLLVYDAPIETFSIGTPNVNTEIKRNLRTITIPKNVTDVVTGQFEDCRYLTAINVSEENEKYSSEDGVLYFKAMSIPSRVITTYLECYPQAKQNETFSMAYDISRNTHFMIVPKAFANCKNLKQIVLTGFGDRGGAIHIENDTFKNCTNLKEIKLTVEDAVSIPNASENAFSGVDVEHCKLIVQCEHYSEYVAHSVWSQFDIQCFGTVIYLNDNSKLVIEDDVLTRQAVDAALDGVSRSDIISIEIGNNVTSIHYGDVFSNTGVFQDCSNLTSVTFGDSIKVIGDAAFSGCYSLTNITIPDNVTHIQTAAFATCTGLTNVEFGSGLIVISDSGFGGCTSLETLYIPYNVQVLGDNAFYNCTSLNSITCDRITPPTMMGGSFNNTNDCPIYVPCESVNEYKSATNWSNYESRIQCRKESGTILYLSDSSTVVIPDNVLTQTLISDVYSGTVIACEIGDNVTEIGDQAFRDCNNLTSVTISDSVTTIGGFIFYECRNISELIIGDGLTGSFSTSDFSNSQPMPGIRHIKIGNGYTSIANKALYYNTTIECFDFGNNIVTIGDDAFGDCNNLTSVTIPDTVTTFGRTCFAHSMAPSSLTITSAVTSIGEAAFFDNLGLRNVKFNENAIMPAKEMFYYCRNLETVDLPSTLTNIRGDSFRFCNNLTSVTIRAVTPPNVIDNMLPFNDTICPIYVPAESVEAYKTAPMWKNIKATRFQPIP